MLKAIVFDFDGVLVDSEPLHFAALREVGAEVGASFDWDQYLQVYIGFDDRDAFREMLVRSGQVPEADQIASMCRKKQVVFERLAAESTRPIPGAMELLDAASVAMPVAIASGATRADIDLMLGCLDRRSRFEVIVSTDDVDRSKPDPTSYRLAVQKLAALHADLHLQPGDCLAIEDTAAGIASARAAGLKTLGVTTTGTPEALRDAHRVVGSLTDVSLDRLQAWYG